MTSSLHMAGRVLPNPLGTCTNPPLGSHEGDDVDIEKNRILTTPKSGSGAKKGKDRVLKLGTPRRRPQELKSTGAGSTDASKTMPTRGDVDYKSRWKIPD